MIKNRNSDAHLSKEMVLDKIREIDIFSYYCPTFKKLGEKFCSSIRKDSRPSVSIVMWGDKLLYKDFGHPEHTFDCFAFIMNKYDCDFYDALKIVDKDFGLELSSHKEEFQFTMGHRGSVSKLIATPKKVVIIKKKSRNWMKKDAEFWSKYLISKKTLTIFAVTPISHYWINANRFSTPLGYAYKIGIKYKIYSPYEEIKWVSNTTKKHVQGFVQLPEKGNLVVLTSSLKDAMCMFEMGISAVALQSEMQMPEENFINALQERFCTIAVFYDNDFEKVDNPGQVMATKICDKFKLRNICIPTEFGVKDISDYIAKYKSLKEAKQLIEKQI